MGIKGVLESEFWDVVDERCVGRAFREPGQQGVEEQLPPLAIVHPDAEETPLHFTLYQWVLQVGWLKFLSWERGRVKLKFVFCCCCTSSNLALSPGPLAGVPA